MYLLNLQVKLTKIKFTWFWFYFTLKLNILYMKKFILINFYFLFFSLSKAHQSDSIIKILIVTAHPDDETGFAATVYKVTKELNGTADQCVITNGEGVYKYSTLS